MGGVGGVVAAVTAVERADADKGVHELNAELPGDVGITAHLTDATS